MEAQLHKAHGFHLTIVVVVLLLLDAPTEETHLIFAKLGERLICVLMQMQIYWLPQQAFQQLMAQLLALFIKQAVFGLIGGNFPLLVGAPQHL